MDKIDAYHITTIDKIASIVKYGLVPNYGGNSRTVSDKTRRIFFTTKENIDFWMNQFKMKKENTIVLNFKARNTGNRIHDKNDLCTDKSISVDEIFVVTSKGKIAIREYYEQNKLLLDELHVNNLRKKIKDVLRMTETCLVENKYTEDNCIQMLDMLAMIIVLEDSTEFIDEVEIIKEGTLKLLLDKIDKGYSDNCENVIKIINKVVNNYDVTLEEIFVLKKKIALGFDYNPNLNATIFMNDMSKFKNDNKIIK